MKLLRNATSEDFLDNIYFVSSLRDLLEQQKTQALKNILIAVDMLVLPDDEHATLRKTILDNINDTHRVTVNMMESMARPHDKTKV